MVALDKKRKYTNQDYFYHPATVAQYVFAVTKNEKMTAAAFLHDVLEDVFPVNNFFDETLIITTCGWEVMRLVKELTDVSKRIRRQS